MAQSRKKNLVFIFADQMHRYALGCMGNKDVNTPNLDKLAEEGALFKNAYSNCPICTPFRINLFTGLYTRQTGKDHNEDRIPRGIPTFADKLNEAGYRTSFVGKWHIGNNGPGPVPKTLRGGFQEFIGFQCYNGFKKDVVFHDNENQKHTYDKHRTDVATDLTLERLENMKDEPFALFLGYQAPHYPVQPSETFAKMYEGAPITRRPNMEDVDPFVGTATPRSPRPFEKDPDWQRYHDDLDEYIRLYYGMVSQIDAGVGRILEKLDELGLQENTFVVFTSDHGDLQGCHGFKNKSKPWEESSGIPLIVNGPELERGIVSEGLIESIDYFPTCMELLGLNLDISLPGKSFAPTLEGKDQDLSGPIFSEFRDWRMIRKGDMKLVVRGNDWSPSELFDLKDDLYEMNNLIEDEDYREDKEKLSKMLQKWRTSHPKIPSLIGQLKLWLKEKIRGL